jgi:leucyl-tRNA synthetase
VDHALGEQPDDGPVDAEAVKYWFPIDLYVGGIEHAILHLVYARFWTKVMRDLGLTTLDEPVVRLFPQGMVHKDGEVMSKSKGNTIAPDEVTGRYGADTLRLYILFAAPPDLHMEWSETGIEGPHRFLLRVWRLVNRHAETFAGEAATPIPSELTPAARELRRKVHQTIDKVTRDIDERIQLNTAVAALMELVNEIYRLEEQVSQGPGRFALREALDVVIRLLNPFTPHICEEMWARLGHRESLVRAAWPAFDAAVAREETVELAVQVNGKVRGRITVPRDAAEDVVRAKALEEPRVAEQVEGKEVRKVLVIPGRLVSVVAK